MTLDMLRVHKNTILRIAQRYHADNIRVFGSVVRGEADESSDIDLLVSFYPGASLLDRIINGLQHMSGRKPRSPMTVGYDLDAFLKDHKTQDAVIRNIEIIGQAVKDFGVENLLRGSPEVPWEQVAGMKNIIAHEYLGIDMALTWEVVYTHLPPLEHAITGMVQEIDEASDTPPHRKPPYNPP